MPIDPLRLCVGTPGKVLLVSLCLAGCNADGMGLNSTADNWGEANRQTMAAQIIDPMPVYDYAVPASSGDLAAKAIERYRTDKVKKPERVQTTKVGKQGSDSGEK